jgi:DNA-binding transcriptional LysR family regulator
VPLLADRLLAVLPAGHPLAQGATLHLEQLAEETWIAGCERCRGHLLHVARTAGFEPGIAFATDDYVTVQSLVASGLGVTLLPALALCAVRRPDVAVRRIEGRPGRTVEVVLPLAARRPPAVTAMIGALRKAAAELAARPEAAALGITAAG